MTAAAAPAERAFVPILGALGDAAVDRDARAAVARRCALRVGSWGAFADLHRDIDAVADLSVSAVGDGTVADFDGQCLRS
jgi:hypothetical protein